MSGITRLSIAPQLAKALFPIIFNPSLKLIAFSWVQFSNAFEPISVIVFGKVTDVMLVLANALLATLVTICPSYVAEIKTAP